MKVRKNSSANVLRIALSVLVCGLAINLFGQSGRIESTPRHWRKTLPDKREVVSETDYALAGTFKIEPNQRKSFLERFWLLLKVGATTEEVSLGCYSNQKAVTQSIAIAKDDMWWIQKYIESVDFTSTIRADVNLEGTRWRNVFGPLTKGEEEVERECEIQEDSWGITKFFKRLTDDYNEKLVQYRKGQQKKYKEKMKSKFPGMKIIEDDSLSGGNVDLTDQQAKEKMKKVVPQVAKDLEYLAEVALAFKNNFMGRQILLRTRNGRYNQIAELDPKTLSSKDIEEAAIAEKRDRGWDSYEMKQWVEHKKRIREEYLKVKKAMAEAKLNASDLYTYLNQLADKKIWQDLVDAVDKAGVSPSVADAAEAFLEMHRMADPYPAIWGWKKTSRGRSVCMAGARKVNSEWDVDAASFNRLLHKHLSRYQFEGALKLMLASECEQVKTKDGFERDCYKLKVVDVNSIKLVPKGGADEREKYVSFDFAADDCFIYVCRETHLIIKVDFYFKATVQEEGKMLAMDRFDDFSLKKGTTVVLESVFKTTNMDSDVDLSFFVSDDD